MARWPSSAEPALPTTGRKDAATTARGVPPRFAHTCSSPVPICNSSSRRIGWTAELLTACRYYPATHGSGARRAPWSSTACFSFGRSTRARMLFHPPSPPPAAASTSPRPTSCRTAPRARPSSTRSARGVDLKIIVPGKHSDHLLTRRSSCWLYGDLLKAPRCDLRIRAVSTPNRCWWMVSGR